MKTSEVTIIPDNEVAKDFEVRRNILDFEKQMRCIPGAHIGDWDDCPLKHTFADGVYVREIFIPKDMLIVGKIHKHSHPNFLMSGEVSVVTESGGVERLKAPRSMISPANTKRIVYTHEDTVWITVHVTEKKDIDEIEEEIILKKYDDLELTKECVEAIGHIKKGGD